MNEVTLQDVLDARERRAWAQERLRWQFGRPLLSFTMNIPGPVKDSPLIRRGFDRGAALLEKAMADAAMPVMAREEQRAFTGCELLCAVDAPAEKLKELCVRIEDGTPLGRLFDMDVIDPEGRKLERGSERGCLVCGAPGRGCASRRLHSLAELTGAVDALLRGGLLDTDAEEAGRLATKALLDEVNATPKPGLVDRRNNGSHTDMTLETFLASAEALKTYWPACFRAGAETAELPPEECFARLRALGLEAEKAMFAATGGVNTHKGVIFSLGTVCGAAGRLWRAEAPCRDPARIAAESGSLCAAAVESDFAAVRQRGEGRTTGEKLYLSYGLRGIRGELRDGLPSVIRVALPALEEALGEGRSRNDAGVLALLRLIALGEDTNMIRRGGLSLARETAARTAGLLRSDPRPSRAAVEALDDAFIRKGLSPGGCADLLAIGYFLLDWKSLSPAGTESKES